MHHFLNKQEEMESWMNEAALVANQATCTRARCGAVIVNDGKVVGRGFNSPPGNDEGQRRCDVSKETYDQKVTDKTCCVHAEQRAVMDALRNHPDQLPGSTMYFMRLDGEGNVRPNTSLSRPYCTICSKMIFDAGIAQFVLMQGEGLCSYETGEYNRISYDYTA